MNKKQQASLIDHLTTQSTKSRQLRAAIVLYALESPFAYALNPKPLVIDGIDDANAAYWAKASDALSARYIHSPRNLEALLGLFGPCFTLAVFWNHVTALFDDLLGKPPRKAVDRSNPIFHIILGHHDSCPTCQDHFSSELQHANWTTTVLSPADYFRTLIRSSQSRLARRAP